MGDPATGGQEVVVQAPTFQLMGDMQQQGLPIDMQYGGFEVDQSKGQESKDVHHISIPMTYASTDYMQHQQVILPVAQSSQQKDN